MTVPQFSRPGAIDLSGLRTPQNPAPGGAQAAAGSFSFDVVGEQSLRTDVVERSMSVVVLVSFWSDQAPASVQINDTLTRLADDFGGRFVLARVDVGSQPELAEVLRIPQVPLVVAALRGQLAPLFQDPIPAAEMRAVIDQVLQAAAANGVTGVAAPIAQPGAVADDEPAEAEPAHPAAEAALLSGDLDTAIAEYEKALAAAPADPEAILGLAQASLLKRTAGIDPAAARAAADAAPDDVAAQSLAADLDLLDGDVDNAFARMIDVVRRTADDARDAARKHLIELFGLVGEQDPRVGRARSALASALF